MEVVCHLWKIEKKKYSGIFKAIYDNVGIYCSS